MVYLNRNDLIKVFVQFGIVQPIPRINKNTIHTIERDESQGNIVLTFKATTKMNELKERLYTMQECIIH